MITGDHPETAHTIATEIGLGNGAPNVITAVEAEIILQSRGPAFLRTVHVIARAIPAQKYAIVNALKSLNEVVVVTGDGVNDVPALRAADIGIAMGERGTQSAREAASIVLLDDNFGSIVNAICEGRQLFKNLQLSFKYILMIHIPYVLSATLIPLFGFPLLYYPIQIVWIELFIHPTCMLVFQELPEQGADKAASSTRGNVSFFSALDWWGIGVVGAYATALVLLAYLISLTITSDPAAARADAFVAVGLTHIALTIGLSRLRTTISRVITIASAVMLVGLVQVPVISHYFNMQPPSVVTWAVLGAASVVTGVLAWWFT
jgi:Ca2+-transporting ATPase